jgi:uncharacterized membrane protein
MSELAKSAILFTAVGALFIGLGIPLLFDRVPPNFWYGCRARKTLSNVEIWYAVNRVTGRALLFGGISFVASAVGVFFFGELITPTSATIIPLVVLIVAVMVMVANSLRVQRSM